MCIPKHKNKQSNVTPGAVPLAPKDQSLMKTTTKPETKTKDNEFSSENSQKLPRPEAHSERQVHRAVDNLTKLRAGRKKKTTEEQQQFTKKLGDIGYCVKGNAKNAKNDDTLCPQQINDESNDGDETEDVDDCDPTEENYMYNNRDIRYTGVELIGDLKNKASNVPPDILTRASPRWDPWAPVEVLKSRSVFTCESLRTNTLATAVLSCSVEKEQEAFRNLKSKPAQTSGPKVAVSPIPKLLKKYAKKEVTINVTCETVATEDKSVKSVVKSVIKNKMPPSDMPVNKTQEAST